jgi:hypothetical protein
MQIIQNNTSYNTQIGYEQFGKMRSDPALCFKALCGEEPVRLRKKKKGKQQETSKVPGTPGGGESEASDSGEEEEDEEESEGEMESGPSTPASHATPTGKRYK